MDPQDLPRGPDGLPGTEHDVAPPAVDPDGGGPSLVLGGVEGPHPVGPATIDSDADGVTDTALVSPSPDAGLLSLATDLDHDGDVDVLTTVGSDGSARTVALDPAASGWGPGHGDAGWDPGWDAPAPPAASIDPATGAWTRSG